MKINLSKIKIMQIGMEHKRLGIKLDGTALERVDGFKYLGTTLTRNAKNEAEVNGRIESAARMYYYSLNCSFIAKKHHATKLPLDQS